MSLLYITADQVGAASGGGLVTKHESDALRALGECEVWGREFLQQVDEQHGRLDDPWKWDLLASMRVGERALPDNYYGQLKLVHFYAGTFSYTIEQLRDCGARICYTAAAHDVELSRREHEKLGVPFDYPHLTDPELWQRYLTGYLAADVLVCPSQHSANVMRKYGRTGPIEIIPHGCELPETVAPLPKHFTVGYLGSCGAPDKGLIYLLQAWKKLNYKDALLVLAGRDSTSPWVKQLVNEYGGGNVWMRGWVCDVGDFYDTLSLYVQPSVTEGFGCEVLEAMAHGRAVVCSAGAGAADVVPLGPELSQFKVHAGDADDLACGIDCCKSKGMDFLSGVGKINREEASKYAWDKIRARYQTMWKGLLA